MSVKTELDDPLRRLADSGFVITGADAMMSDMLKRRAADIAHTVETLSITHEDGTAPVPWSGDPFVDIDIDLSPPTGPPTWTELDFPEPEDIDIPGMPGGGGVSADKQCPNSRSWLQFYWNQFLRHGSLQDLERAMRYLRGLIAAGCPFDLSTALKAWTIFERTPRHMIPSSWSEWLMMATRIRLASTPDLPIQRAPRP